MRDYRNAEPCWTGLSDGICSRGGIGCPLPHAGEGGPYLARGVLEWNPLDYGIEYPPGSTPNVCPVHHCSNSWGDRTVCRECPFWKRTLQWWRLVRWTRDGYRVRKDRRRFVRELRKGPPA